MSGVQMNHASKSRIACILGMTMVWPSIHNQLLYPISFSFHKSGDADPYIYYMVYCLVLLATTIAATFALKGDLTKRMFSSKAVMAAFGVLGAIGIAMIVGSDLASSFSQAMMWIGVVLSAVFVPIYFIFWSTRIVYASEEHAGFDLLISYFVFCVITLFRLMLKLHAWPFAICYPLIAAALAVYVSGDVPKKKFALKRASFTSLPLLMLIPMAAFVYIATAVRCLMNPVSATYDYPSDHRIWMYMILGAISLVLAAFYNKDSKVRQHASLLSFTVAVIVLTGGVLFTGLNSIDGSPLGNLPAIAGTNMLEVIIWVFVLSNAQLKHIGILRSSSIYLIFIIGACHITSVLFMMSTQTLDFNTNDLPLLTIIIVAAFIIFFVVNAVMTAMLYKAQNKKQMMQPMAVAGATGHLAGEGAADDVSGVSAMGADGTGTAETGGPLVSGMAPATPACVALSSDEAALRKIQDTFGLSRREIDTARFAYKNMPTKEIAKCMFVAESTVNSHLKGIYRKCDVHSRQELIGLINRFKSGVE